MLTDEEIAALRNLSAAMEREIKRSFGRTPESLDLWIRLRHLPELSAYGEACHKAGREQC